MDVFTRRALTLSRFDCPLAEFNCENLDEQSEAVDRGWDLVDFTLHFPEVESRFSETSKDKNCCKHAKKKYIKRAKPDYPPIESKKQKERKQ